MSIPAHRYEVPAGRLRSWLEKKQIVARRIQSYTHYPVKSTSLKYPDEVFFYGTLLEYARAFPKRYEFQSGVAKSQIAPEKIVGVANYDHFSGLVWLGLAPLRHHHLFQYMDEYGVDWVRIWYAEQGFMTSFGRWVDRVEGLRVAKHAKQLKLNPDGSQKHAHNTHLFSEDLW